jgi:hypothetical protein
MDPQAIKSRFLVGNIANTMKLLTISIGFCKKTSDLQVVFLASTAPEYFSVVAVSLCFKEAFQESPPYFPIL